MVRLGGWVVTGPAAHLWAGLVDWAALVVRLGWGRLRSRVGR